MVFSIKIEVPGPPMGVGRARSRIVTAAKTGGGIRQFVAHYTPTNTRNEAAVIRQYAQDAMAGRAPFTGAVELRMAMYFAIPESFSKTKRIAALNGSLRPTTKPDWDNCGKFTDALSKVVWLDDKQVTDAHAWKRYSDKPRVIMEITPLTKEDLERPIKPRNWISH